MSSKYEKFLRSNSYYYCDLDRFNPSLTTITVDIRGHCGIIDL